MRKQECVSYVEHKSNPKITGGEEIGRVLRVGNYVAYRDSLGALVALYVYVSQAYLQQGVEFTHFPEEHQLGQSVFADCNEGKATGISLTMSGAYLDRDPVVYVIHAVRSS